MSSFHPWVRIGKESEDPTSSVFPSYTSGVHHFWWQFLHMWPFLNPTIKVVTFRLHGWCSLGVVFFANIHLSRTWMSASFESVRWNACVHRLDLGLYALPKEFWGNGVRTMLTPREKSPLPEKFSPEEERPDAVPQMLECEVLELGTYETTSGRRVATTPRHWDTRGQHPPAG